MRWQHWFYIAVSAGTLLASCSREIRLYSTWDSLGQNPGKTNQTVVEALPPIRARPWGGTVSHHLLANTQIDRWFAELSSRRTVSCFYILSPSHWGLSTQMYSITDGSWRIKGELVESDRPRARALAKTLDVKLEPSVFDPEHGISTLIPYIAKYFPKAKVVAIAYRGEPPLDQPMAERLFTNLQPAFSDKESGNNFLLISTDFSHHGDIVSTETKDERSREFFTKPSLSTWIVVGCDNRPGIYILSRFLDSTSKSTVLFNCNSFQLTGQDSDDITSYFFTYFW